MSGPTKRSAHVKFILDGEAAQVVYASHKTLLEVFQENIGGLVPTEM